MNNNKKGKNRTTPTKVSNAHHVSPSSSKSLSSEPFQRLPLQLIVDPVKASSFQRDFVYFNVKTMKDTGICLGDPVIICSADVAKVIFVGFQQNKKSHPSF
jgi:hypothetical protein